MISGSGRRCPRAGNYRSATRQWYLTSVKSVPKPIHFPRSLDAWIALVPTVAGVLVYEPSVRIALLVMLTSGIAFAGLFRMLRRHRESGVLTLNLTDSPRSSSLQTSVPSSFLQSRERTPSTTRDRAFARPGAARPETARPSLS